MDMLLWIVLSVVVAEGERPVPSRTRKLSPPAPMVLHPPGCGRVGRRRHSTCESPAELSAGLSSLSRPPAEGSSARVAPHRTPDLLQPLARLGVAVLVL